MGKKLTILILFLSNVVLAQHSTTGTLAQVLSQIERRYDVKFAYDYQLANSKEVEVPDYSQPLLDVLESSLVVNGFDYDIGNRVIIITPAQPKVKGVKPTYLELAGFVRDRSSGDPLPNATVLVLSNQHFATTNANGYFQLKKVPSDTSTIQVKFVGYTGEVMTYNQLSRGLISIGLNPDPELLDPVLVEENVETFGIADEPGKIDISPAKMELISGMGQPDIVRTIQLLPGVVATGESSSGFTVRGGGPDQNLVLFDGFSLYSIDHFFGVFSAFNTNVVEDVSLFKSGFGPRYGGRVSSVLDIQSRNGTNSGGVVGIDMTSANFTVEKAISDKVSVLIGGRRSYTDFIKTNTFNNVVDNVKSNRPNDVSDFATDNFVKLVDPEFNYHDLNLKVNTRFTDNQNLSFSLYNSRDRLVVDESEFVQDEDLYFDQQFSERTEWGNTGMSLIYSYEWSPVLNSKLTVANSSFYRTNHVDYYLDYQSQGFNSFLNVDVRDKNTINETSLKLDNQYSVSRNSTLNFGTFVTNNQIRYFNVLDPSLGNLDLKETAGQYGVYAEHSYQPLPNLSLTGGLRGTYYTGTDNTYLEPRFMVNYSPYPSLNLKGALGRYYQFVSQASTINPYFTQDSFWLVADGVNVAAIGSNHYVGGFTFSNNIVTIDIEGYYKTLNGLTTYSVDSADIQSLEVAGRPGVLYNGGGRVRGMDVMVSRNFGKLNTWVSYSLSSVRHRFNGINEGKEFNADQDQRHELKWVGVYKLGNWEFSGTFVYGSGRPYTGFPFINGQNIIQDDIVDQVIRGGSQNNNLRIPDYHRFDLGISYSKDFGKHTSGQMGINIFNLYNRTNVNEITYDVNLNSTSRTLNYGERRTTLLELTPSLFFNFYF